MHQRSLKLLLVGLVATLPACYATGGYGYTTGYVTAPTVQAQVGTDGVAIDASAQVAAPTIDASVQVGAPVAQVQVQAPQLVAVDSSPTVQVFADYQEPIFFTDNTYWRYTNNNWYRSASYTGGWTYEASVPYAVRSIDRPDRYRHYRPAGYTPRTNYNSGHYNGGHNSGYATHNNGYNRGTYTPPARGYNSGWQPSHNSGYQPKSGGYTQPARGGSYTPPARTGYTQPARTGYNSGYNNPPPTRSYNSGWQPTHSGGYTQPQPKSGGYNTPPPRGNTGYTPPAPRNTGYKPANTGYTAPPAQRVRDHRTAAPAPATKSRPATRDHRK